MTELDAKVFREAAKLVRTKWGRGCGYAGPMGAHCALTAILRAKNYFVDSAVVREVAFVADVLGRAPGEGATDRVIRFNDREARTGAEVAAVLDLCAEKLETEATR